MAGQVTFTPAEEDIVAGSRDWFLRALRQPRMKGAMYIALLAGALLGAAFALQSGAPPDHALRAAGIGAIAGLLLVAAILALRYALLPGQARRSFRQNRTVHQTYTYRWTDEAIGWESGASSARIPWPDLYRWGEGRSAFLFAVSERGVHFVPRRALDEAEAADLRATAIRHGPARL
jgi:YcxB-like protein